MENKYTFTIQWNSDLNQYVASVAEMPMLAAVNEYPISALRLLINSIKIEEGDKNNPMYDSYTNGGNSGFDW